jgi:AcrR family transcriptional regulator
MGGAMNQKNNQRFQETDRLIRAYFLRALEEKEISKISVREICEAVGINRSSFYLHYQDVYALLEALCNEVGKELFEDFAEVHDEAQHYFSGPYLLVLLRHVKKHYKLYRAYVANVGMTQIDLGYQALFESVFKPYFKKLGMTSEHHMEYHFVYVKAGFFAVLGKWMQYDCAESPKALAEIIKKSMPPIPDGLPDMNGI